MGQAVDFDRSGVRADPGSLAFSGYQKFVIGILAFLQFTIMLDFMILSPLGAVLMPALQITPSQFGRVVSAYAFSAGLSGLLAAGFADKFDRKSLLLFFYTGFIAGTLFCGLATSYELLLAARVVTGIFGGVIGSITLAITTDLFPLQMRGRVMGLLQTSFAASQVLGVPAGIFISNHWGWHMPFFMIVVIAAAAGVLIWWRLEPVRGHLALQTRGGAFSHLLKTLVNPRYTLAFATTGLLSVGGFMLMPFGSAFSVHNLHVDLGDLPTIYLVTGLAAIALGPLVGRAADRFGKFKTFVFGGCLSAIMVTIYTHLGATPLALVILVNVILFAGVFSRMIPAQALMSAIPDPANRGSFMAVSSSLQQVAGGVASMVAGLLVHEAFDGRIENFEYIGYVVTATSFVTMFLMYFIDRRVRRGV